MEKQYTYSKQKIFAVALIVLVAGGVGYHVYFNVFMPKHASLQETGGVSSGVSSGSVAVETEGKGDYTIEQIPLSEQAPKSDMPPLRRPIVFSSAFPEEARVLMRQKIEASIAALEKNPRIFEEWMQLAILRKTVDDYEGAREIWEFLKTTNPQQAGPYANLAALYTYELKNPALAEQNFIEAIRKGPKELSVYRNAYDFYRYVQKDDLKAKQILQDGIKETQSTDLQYLLDHYGEL